MVAVSFGVAWAGYSVFLMGWFMFRRYDINMRDLFKPTAPSNLTWPPPPIADTAVFPTGTAGAVAQ
jgi:hypothetical protein